MKTYSVAYHELLTISEVYSVTEDSLMFSRQLEITNVQKSTTTTLLSNNVILSTKPRPIEMFSTKRCLPAKHNFQSLFVLLKYLGKHFVFSWKEPGTFSEI